MFSPTSNSTPSQQHEQQHQQLHRILAKIKPGSFRYTTSSLTSPQSNGTVCPAQDPIIAIGPGTGVAALHAVVEHRFAQLIAQQYIQDPTFSLISLLAQPNSPISPSQVLAQSSSWDQMWVTVPQEPLNKVPTQPEMSTTTTPTATNPTQTAVHLLTAPFLPTSPRALPPFSILFGCRSAQGDHFYRDFFNFAVRFGALSNYQAVFSRTPTNPNLTPTLLRDIQDLVENGQGEDNSTTIDNNNNNNNKNSNPLTNSTTNLQQLHLKAYEFPTSPSQSCTSTPSTLPSHFYTPHDKDKYVQHRIASNHLLLQQLLDLVSMPLSEPLSPSLSPPPTATASAAAPPQTLPKTVKFNLDPHKLLSATPATIGTTGGAIIVAGNANKMPLDVQNAIVDAVYDSIIASVAFAQTSPMNGMGDDVEGNQPAITPVDPAASRNVTKFSEVCAHRVPAYPPLVAKLTELGVTAVQTHNIYGEPVVIKPVIAPPSSSAPVESIDHVRLEVTRDDVKRFINLMAKSGRYILECWM